MTIDLDRQASERFLIERGAERVPHPGGTLFAHLKRVAVSLNTWSAPEHLELAGLCHAVYGTDGFGTALVHLGERERVRALVGSQAESIIYTYASVDRGFLYAQIGRGSRVLLRDRFSTTTRELSRAELCHFMELTAANELDVITHSPDIAAQYGGTLVGLMDRARELLSSDAVAAWEQLCLITGAQQN